MQNSPDVIGDKFCLAIQRQDVMKSHIKLKNDFSCVVWRKAI